VKDDTASTRPRPAACICGTSARITRSGPVTIISKACDQSSSVMAINGLTGGPP
jgi:hypothetical protein